VDLPAVSLMQLREALEASWDYQTALLGSEPDGKCSPWSMLSHFPGGAVLLPNS
jgi:hypothetical protein